MKVRHTGRSFAVAFGICVVALVPAILLPGRAARLAGAAGAAGTAGEPPPAASAAATHETPEES